MTKVLGKICTCKAGKTGFVQKVRDGIYYGINVDTLGAWQSNSPEPVEETLHRKLLDKLRGDIHKQGGRSLL